MDWLFNISEPAVHLLLVFGIWIVWIWNERKRPGSILASFPMVAGAMFIVGTFKSNFEDIFGIEMQYMLFRKQHYLPASRFAVLCFIMLVIGYVITDTRNTVQAFRAKIFLPAAKHDLILMCWTMLITAALLRFSSSSYIMFSSASRGDGAFDRIFDGSVILMRILIPLVAAMAPLLSRKPPWPHPVGWWAMGLITLSDLITYNRGTTAATALALLGSTLIMMVGWNHSRNLRVTRLAIYKVIGITLAFVAVVITAREIYRKSSIRTTGLLSLMESYEEVSHGYRNENEHGLPLPIGGVHTLTIVMGVNASGCYQDSSDFLFELNPLPNFILKDDSAFWLTRILGYYGISGFPLPMVADAYNFFGWFGCLLFIPVGFVGRRMWVRTYLTNRNIGNCIPIRANMMYAAMLIGFWYGCSIMNFRPYIRMMLNTYIFIIFMDFLFHRFGRSILIQPNGPANPTPGMPAPNTNIPTPVVNGANLKATANRETYITSPGQPIPIPPRANDDA